LKTRHFLFKYFAALGVSCVIAVFCSFGHAADEGRSENPLSITVNGKTLRLIGSGLREFLFFDIYTMSAYSESGRCDVQSIVYKDETKYLRLNILREISRGRMVSTLKDTLTKNLPPNPSEKLKQNIDAFLTKFTQDLQKGSIVEIVYLPGNGTLLKQNGRQLGAPTEGKDFSDTLWKSYFGSDTCCSGLKSSILEQCNR
jgi:hypothetical protein